MLITAHADDEGIFFGGAIAFYSVVKNLPVMIINMTHSKTDGRAEELRCAVSRYGGRYEPIFGGFGDCCFGKDLECNWDCWGGKDRAVKFLTEQIRRYKPDVVLLHDFGGEYGHPNHMGSGISGAEACLAAGDPLKYPENLSVLPIWEPKKCYVHLYSENQMTHSWDMECEALGNKTPRAVTNAGLECHVSQGERFFCINGCDNQYAKWPAEKWGLYHTTVGNDIVAENDFFENITMSTRSTMPADSDGPLFNFSTAPNHLHQLDSLKVSFSHIGETMNVAVFDLEGRLVKKFNSHGFIGDLSNGIYVVQAQFKHKSVCKRIFLVR